MTLESETKASGPIRITMQSGITILVDDPAGTVRVEMENGRIITAQPDGSASLRHSTDAGTIRIERDGAVQIDSSGSISFRAGKSFRVKAETIELDAVNIKAKAAMNLDLAGMNISSKALMKNRMEGTIIESQSGTSHNTAAPMVCVESKSLYTLKAPVAVQISSNGKHDLELEKLQQQGNPAQ